MLQISKILKIGGEIKGPAYLGWPGFLVTLPFFFVGWLINFIALSSFFIVSISLYWILNLPFKIYTALNKK